MRAGLVALIGRPNVGKSTLLNALLGTKLSIVSPKPQTTRHQVIGVLNRDQAQLVFVDTPGQADTEGKALNRALDRSARAAMTDVDLILWVIEAGRWTAADDELARRAAAANAPLGIVLSKIDRFRDRKRLLPVIADVAGRVESDFLVPLSAKSGDNLDTLVDEVVRRMPEGEPFYDAQTLTPHGDDFLAAERIREQLFRRLHQELPYGIAVTVDQREWIDASWRIHATIWLDRASHKRIVNGAQGKTLKAIGEAARRDLERHFGAAVDLQLWVKVREGWADNAVSLRTFGYDRGGE